MLLLLLTWRHGGHVGGVKYSFGDLTLFMQIPPFVSLCMQIWLLVIWANTLYRVGFEQGSSTCKLSALTCEPCYHTVRATVTNQPAVNTDRKQRKMERWWLENGVCQLAWRLRINHSSMSNEASLEVCVITCIYSRKWWCYLINMARY